MMDFFPAKSMTFAAIVALPYLLVSNLLVPSGAIFAERFLYLPVAGLCLLMSLAIGTRARRLAIPAALLIALSGAAMFARSLDWRNDATIFARTARNNPKSPRAPFWIGRLDDAIANWPEYAAPWHDKGLELAKAGELPGAERALRESVRLEPGRAAPHLNLGLVLHRAGQREAAEREVRKSILLDPDNPRAHAELGHLRYESGRLGLAAESYQRAIALGRTDLVPRLEELRGQVAH
jgi:tetratricopeptide (TPR) repeat protein